MEQHQGYIPDINEIITKIKQSTYDYTDVSIDIKNLFYDDLKEKTYFTQENLLVLLDFLLEEEKRKKDYHEKIPKNRDLITSLDPLYTGEKVKYGFLNQDFNNAKEERKPGTISALFNNKVEKKIVLKQKIKNIKITNMPNIKTIQDIIQALGTKNNTYQINKNVDYRTRDDIYYTYVFIHDYLVELTPPVNTTGGKRKRKTKRKRLNKKKRKSARRKR